MLQHASEQEELTRRVSEVVGDEGRQWLILVKVSSLRTSLMNTLDMFRDMRQAVQSIAEQASTMRGVAQTTVESVHAVEAQASGGVDLAENVQQQKPNPCATFIMVQRLVGAAKS